MAIYATSGGSGSAVEVITVDAAGAYVSGGGGGGDDDVIAFSTTANLADGATYSSGLLQLSPQYSQVLTNIFSTRNGTLSVYWYSDVGGTDLVRTLTIAYLTADGFQSFGAPAFTRSVKYEFTNSAGAATTDFYYATRFAVKALNPQIATLSSPLTSGMVGAVSRSVIAGVTTAGGGAFVNVKVNPSGTLETNATLAAGTNSIGSVTANAGTGTFSVQGIEAAIPMAGSILTLNPSANFTRPADTTAYVVGDLVANSTTAGSVVPLSFATAARVAAGSFVVRKVRLHKSSTSVTSASFRIWLFTATPTIATTGDNGVFTTVVSGGAGFIGTSTISSMLALADCAVGNAAADTGSDMMVDLTSGTTIYALIEARGAYTPGNAEVFTVTLELMQN